MKQTAFFLLAVCAVSGHAAADNKIDDIIRRHAAANGVNPNLVRAVIRVESAGNPNAHSNKDARGLMQVLPETASRMGINPAYLFHPEHNIAAGTRYLAYLSRQFNGRLDYILAGYNAGEGAVQKYGGIPPYRETRNYVVQVSRRYADLQGGAVPHYGVPTVGQDAREGEAYRNWVFSVPAQERAAEPAPVAAQPARVAVRRPSNTVVASPAPDMRQPEQQPAPLAAAEPTSPRNDSFVQTLDKNGNFINI